MPQKLPEKETDEDNVVRQDQAKGVVRPEGPGDETSPVKPEPAKRPDKLRHAEDEDVPEV
ncbi:MAG TPA: hypothetical protein VIU61_16395 [Kofleriaceae bacterium]